jgi:hypothetical protein
MKTKTLPVEKITKTLGLPFRDDYSSLFLSGKASGSPFNFRRSNMFLAKVTHREHGAIEKLELKSDDLEQMLKIILGWNDLDIIEIHIHKEGEGRDE